MPVHITIDDAVVEQFPNLKISWFIVRKLKSSLAHFDASPMLSATQSELTALNLSPEQIGQLPLLTPWREAYATQGVKPAQFRSSVEALIRRFAKGKYDSIGIPIVDAYNALSATFQVPMGAYDIAKLANDSIVLRPCKSDDNFDPLGGNSKDYRLDSSIAVYAVGSEILCWCLNHRDSRSTCVDASTDEALVLAESINPIQFSARVEAIRQLRQLLATQGADLSEVHELP